MDTPLFMATIDEAERTTGQTQPGQAETPPRDPRRGARLRQAQREQIAWGRIDLDAQLPEDHPARAIWAVVERLELSALYAPIAAREIWRLTEVHAAYRWLRGGVDVGYHTLSDFRSQRSDVLDKLIPQVLAMLMKHDLVDLSRVAQDGTRVRASAGAGSFRRASTLEALMQQAREHLEAVTREAADPAFSARRAAARKRGAQQRIERPRPYASRRPIRMHG